MFAGFELRRIPYALALAQELNFGRAALRLHVAQPSMTNQIRQLEDEINVQLFERSSQHVKLTPAGRRFIKEAKLAVLHSERAIEQAKSAEQAKCTSCHRLFPAHQLRPSLRGAIRQRCSSRQI